MRSRRVGVATFYRLLAKHQTAQAALKALPDVARAAGVARYEVCPEQSVAAELRAGRQANARLLCRGMSDYPASLYDLPDAPPILWAVGNLDLLQQPTVGLVGARNASSLGTRMARALAKDLGKSGQVVVSGMARGVDTAAHIGALDSGTIAVLAGGVDVLYPNENAQLGQDIGRLGLRLSEQPMGMKPLARHFPLRNRIISGLSRAVVVVEAAAGSGSLITARNALDQGRDVFAVPGHPFDSRAAGCNMLLRDGATLVRNASDVLEALPIIQSPLPQSELDTDQAPPLPRSAPDIAELHRQILTCLGPSPIAEDQLVRDVQAGAQQVGSAVVELELMGKIKRQAGGLLCRAS